MKNLVYITVFLKKEMLELMKLFLLSMTLYSRTDTFDILVMTSQEFVNDVQYITRLLDLPIKIFLTKCESVADAMINRLHIFKYKDIEQYSKLLYLDIDIIIQGDITRLFELEIEDKIYPIREYNRTINDNLHYGKDFFDFSKIDKNTPAINAGVFLFNNSKVMKNLFQIILDRISLIRKENTSHVFLEQQLLNYYGRELGLIGNDSIMITHIKLINTDAQMIPISPLKDKDIIIQHFIAGNSISKTKKMKEYLQHLIDSYSMVKSKSKNTSNQVEFKQYNFDKGHIFFDSSKSKKLITTWQNGSYECLHDRVYTISWCKIRHLVIFSKGFSRYTFVRLDNMIMGSEYQNNVN